MRKVFAQTLVELAGADHRLVLLTADLGYGVLDEFAAEYPNRFFNVGVAEANMVGLATGLAEAGYIPFLYSIATFASLRPYEQWRNGPVVHQLPVRLVGIGGGYEYGANGITHSALEDLGAMRLMSGTQIVVPADERQVCSALRATFDAPHPVYYRISKCEGFRVPELSGQFDPQGVEIIRRGENALVIAMGTITAEALLAADLLAAKGIEVDVAVLSSLAPAPRDALRALLQRHSLVATVETHLDIGALGSLVAEVIAEGGVSCRQLRCGIGSAGGGISGSEAFMNARSGLDAHSLAERIGEGLAS